MSRDLIEFVVVMAVIGCLFLLVMVVAGLAVILDNWTQCG